MSDTLPRGSRVSRKVRNVLGKALGAPALEDKHSRLKQIEKLDPVDDCVEVYRLFVDDFKASSAFAVTGGLFVTFAVPRISRILTQSRQFEDELQKRLVDTVLLDHHIHDKGFVPGLGRDSMRRVNEMHRQYDIHPEDYVFIGCWEAVSYIWYAENYGWRPVTEKEKLAAVTFVKLRARHMYGGEKKMPYPETLEAMETFCADYLDAQIAYEPQNKRLGATLLDYVLKDYPKILHRPIQAFFFSVGPDDRLITNCGFDLPSPRAKKISRKLMRLYAKLDPMPGGLTALAQDLVAKEYPDGYQVDLLGTHVNACPRARMSADDKSTVSMAPAASVPAQ
ncbi:MULTISPECIES: oxygenase MpaB family protein [Nocardiaceae]|uniref:ER-bound oxygenase mpaB/mpaB'/Rubber oxygenase catalytic domain-containing protein n=1 Tax=Rhodococcoides corynebacterioides TaxID=53972 RepID=A0ABS2KZT8_9NOCA|nr:MULTISPECIES: oxygenase MpaB family protein [Rhodococcus]MBM7417446.1 hypothetical protein [Rhodococcus corynebacterioides]MBP1115700.1 hypothetical protein [Rhodococcus sp. PvP016]